MEALKGSLIEMSKSFQCQMDDFQRELQQSSSAASTASSLPGDFTAFRKFILAALTSLHNQVDLLGRELDRSEMRRRRKMILLHGVPEEKSEETATVISTLISTKLQVSGFSKTSISRCHRLGRPSDKSSRPVVVKFSDIVMRDKVWFSKTKLKGTGITQSEFLTRRRHSVFLEARRRFGVTKCWTRDGVINILTPDGTRHQIETLSELDTICNGSTSATRAYPTVVEENKVPEDKSAPQRSKRIGKK